VRADLAGVRTSFLGWEKHQERKTHISKQIVGEAQVESRCRGRGRGKWGHEEMESRRSGESREPDVGSAKGTLKDIRSMRKGNSSGGRNMVKESHP